MAALSRQQAVIDISNDDHDIPPTQPLTQPVLQRQDAFYEPRSPTIVPASFRFHGQRVHLTYRDHIPHDKVLALLETIAPLNRWSIVWEAGHNGAEDHDAEVTPYDHTHVAVQFVHSVQRKGPKAARMFDIGDIHPHIRVIRSEKQWIATTQYHQKAPIKLTTHNLDKDPQELSQMASSRQRPRVSLYWGVPNSGKTFRARAISPSSCWEYSSTPTGTWFDNYAGEECMIFDEVDKLSTKLDWSLILRICNEGRCDLPRKGLVNGKAFIPCLAKNVVFIANSHPDHWMPETVRNAFFSRCHECLHFRCVHPESTRPRCRMHRQLDNGMFECQYIALVLKRWGYIIINESRVYEMIAMPDDVIKRVNSFLF